LAAPPPGANLLSAWLKSTLPTRFPASIPVFSDPPRLPLRRLAFQPSRYHRDPPIWFRKARLPDSPDSPSLPAIVSKRFDYGSSFQTRYVSRGLCSSNLLEPVLMVHRDGSGVNRGKCVD
jgi:hypothetical protein